MTELQAVLCAEFEAMDRGQQMNVLQKDGVYIGKLKTGSHRLLYQYATIYVEVFYFTHRGEIKHIQCQADTAILDDYFLSSKGEESSLP